MLIILLGLTLLLQVVVIYTVLTKKYPTQEPCRFKETQIPSFECKATPHVCQFHEPPVRKEIEPLVLPTVEYGRRKPENVEILTCLNGAWIHYAWRSRNHKDLPDYLNAPGFALRYPDGTLEEGNQNG